MWNKIWAFVKGDVVLTASALLAIGSCFLTPPDKEYLGYLNAQTLIVLFCFMAVMVGLKEMGAFQRLGEALLRRLSRERTLAAVLVGLCFFGSMVITNDVALITFVPLAVLVLDMAGRRSSLCLTVTLMTVAANLGSILTPIGNPQNLYLFAVSGMSLGEFFAAMGPYSLLAAALLALAVWFGYQPAPIQIELEGAAPPLRRGELAFYAVLFCLCLLTVAKVLSCWALLALVVLAMLLKNRRLLLQVDYSLLATFVFLFIFVGNMGRFGPFRDLVQSLVEGRELVTGVVLSQIISNVPAALLLSGFTDRWTALLAGVNIGGLGTLIASMASLISYKQVALRAPEQKGRYLLIFTLWNAGFLAALLALAWIIR